MAYRRRGFAPHGTLARDDRPGASGATVCGGGAIGNEKAAIIIGFALLYTRKTCCLSRELGA
jgi:hypothetical protein